MPSKITPSGVLDETGLSFVEALHQAPRHVVRLLDMPPGCGVRMESKNVIAIPTGQGDVLVRQDAFNAYMEVATLLRTRIMVPENVSRPMKREDILWMYDEAIRATQSLTMYPADKARVLFLQPPEGGVMWYRCVQPVNALQKHLLDHKDKALIIPDMSTLFSIDHASMFDAVVIPRTHTEAMLSMAYRFQQRGVAVLYEIDDMLWGIPDWNPAKKAHGRNEHFRLCAALKMADAVISSTEELRDELEKEFMGVGAKTHVCHNFIDQSLWPANGAYGKFKPGIDRMRILWAGSATHSEDLKLLLGPIREMKNRNVSWVFVGERPDLSAESLPKDYVEFHPGCSCYEWPQYISDLKCHVAVAPLVDCAFNRCKSELKVLEAWALGMPVVAFSVAPFVRAIRHGDNGMLADGFGLAATLQGLYRERRDELVRSAFNDLKAKYSGEAVVPNYERAVAHALFVRGNSTPTRAALRARCIKLLGDDRP